MTSPAPASKTPGLAIASLVLGLSSVMGAAILVLPTVLAIVLGHVALRRIQKDPQFTGAQTALLGTLLGYASILIGAVLAAVVIPSVRQSREERHRESVLEDARLISAAAQQYMMENGVREVAFELDAATGAIAGPLASYVRSIHPGTRAIDRVVELDGSFSLQNPRVARGAEIVFDWEGNPR
jgi:hypothetical protein